VPQDNGVLFRASIERNSPEAITNHGFIISSSNIPNLQSSEIILSLGSSTEQPQSFQERLESSLDSETQYFVRAFLKTESFTVYGLITSFTDFTTSLTPHIGDYEPKVGMSRDTLFFSGRNFPIRESSISVRIGGWFAPVVEAQPTAFQVIIPGVAINEWHDIDLQINSVPYPVKTPLEVVDFTFGFTPRKATFLDTIRLRGVFPNVTSSTIPYKVFFDGVESEVIDFQRNIITVLVPNKVRTATPSITVSVPDSIQGSFTPAAPIQLLKPEIIAFDGAAMKRGEPFTIQGNYFNPTPEGNKVFADDRELVVEQASAGQITASWSGVPVPDRDFSLIVEVAELRDTALVVGPIPELEIWQEWIDMPLSGLDNYLIFETEKGIYVGFGERGDNLGNELYRYSLSEGTWTEVPIQGFSSNPLTDKKVWKQGSDFFILGLTPNYYEIFRFNQENESFEEILRVNDRRNTINDIGSSPSYPGESTLFLFDDGGMTEFNHPETYLPLFFRNLQQQFIERGDWHFEVPLGLVSGKQTTIQYRLVVPSRGDESVLYHFEYVREDPSKTTIEWRNLGPIVIPNLLFWSSNAIATSTSGDSNQEEYQFLFGPRTTENLSQLLYGNARNGYKYSILPLRISTKNILSRQDGSIWVPSSGKIWRFEYR